MVVPLTVAPPSSDGFYAVNNPFLVSGPKGFTEFKMLENEDMFIRIDFPGVPQDSIKVRIDPTKKAVSIDAVAPKEHKHDSSARIYGSTTGLVCRCCEISGMVSHMSDGVLRLHLSKTHAPSPSPSCIFSNGISGVDFIDNSQTELSVSAPTVRQTRSISNIQVHGQMVDIVPFPEN